MGRANISEPCVDADSHPLQSNIVNIGKHHCQQARLLQLREGALPPFGLRCLGMLGKLGMLGPAWIVSWNLECSGL